MHDIKVITGYPEKYLDADGKEQTRTFYSFTVDGVPSLQWYPECKVEGLPPDYYVQRCLSRLKAGRSSEAFGDMPLVAVDGVPVKCEDASADGLAAVEKQLAAAGVAPDLVARTVAVLRKGSKKGRGSVHEEAGAPEVETVTHGGRQKPRARRKGWKYTLDGIESDDTFPSESTARAACAIAAFMTRHKLGAIPAALEQLRAEFPGKDCKVFVCPEEHTIKATVDGKRYAIGWVNVGGTWTVQKFKEYVEG